MDDTLNYALNSMACEEVEIIDLESPNIVSLDYLSTSKGNQRKFYNINTKEYIKIQFDYQGVLWEDYKVERLSTILYKQLKSVISEVVEQRVIKTKDGFYGVASKDFCIDCEWISFARFAGTEVSKSFGLPYRVYQTIMSEYLKLGIDATLYLDTMIILDFLLLNEDRHLNNFGILRVGDEFKIPPLFDFGLGLFEHDLRYKCMSLEKALNVTECKTFDYDQRRVIDMLINRGNARYIKKICNLISVPNIDLFPSHLAYEYFNYALSYLKEVSND